MNNRAKVLFDEKLRNFSEKMFKTACKHIKMPVTEKIVDKLWWPIWRQAQVRPICDIIYTKLTTTEKKWML